LTLTVVNPDVSQARETEVLVRGAKLKSATATVLTNSDIHAHNTFAKRDVVTPHSQSAEIKGDVLSFRFAPASVTRLSVQLV
jgi:alpha-L-arabinofuranosidase